MRLEGARRPGAPLALVALTLLLTAVACAAGSLRRKADRSAASTPFKAIVPQDAAAVQDSKSAALSSHQAKGGAIVKAVLGTMHGALERLGDDNANDSQLFAALSEACVNQHRRLSQAAMWLEQDCAGIRGEAEAIAQQVKSIDRARRELAGEPRAEFSDEQHQMNVDGKASLRAVKNKLKDLSVLASETLRRYHSRKNGLKSVQAAGQALWTCSGPDGNRCCG